MTNISSVLNEEGQWKFPHEFNPENFLNDQGEFVKPEAYLPFSAGKWTIDPQVVLLMRVFVMRVLRTFQPHRRPNVSRRSSGSYGGVSGYRESAEEVQVHLAWGRRRTRLYTSVWNHPDPEAISYEDPTQGNAINSRQMWQFIGIITVMTNKRSTFWKSHLFYNDILNEMFSCCCLVLH